MRSLETNFNPHRTSIVIRILLCLILFSSCQKIEYEDEEDTHKKTEQKDDDYGDTTEDDENQTDDSDSTIPARRNLYTVTQFLEEAPAAQVWVEGYIVGACKQKIGNARFAPPFTYDTAILLADGTDKTKKGEYIPVCLKSGSRARKQLNLKDNPGMYHKKVRIYAMREKYFGVTGIKNIDDYKVVE
ncbi:MAG: DUF6359 domain-containing protein [Prevotella sp.]|nr:DUF6359 domain-containing protein [Prevotella sp.]